MSVKITFKMKIKNRAQAVLLLWTMKEAGAPLDEVKVDGGQGEISGTEALNAWQAHAAKKLSQGYLQG